MIVLLLRMRPPPPPPPLSSSSDQHHSETTPSFGKGLSHLQSWSLVVNRKPIGTRNVGTSNSSGVSKFSSICCLSRRSRSFYYYLHNRGWNYVTKLVHETDVIKLKRCIFWMMLVLMWSWRTVSKRSGLEKRNAIAI